MLRVDKQVPVPALKKQIASVTGVLSEQQCLICPGNVLKDDQLLSAYCMQTIVQSHNEQHYWGGCFYCYLVWAKTFPFEDVEHGHTLHMVVRQLVLPSSSGGYNHTGTSRSHGNQVAPRVIIETFNVPDQGDGDPPEISQIVSAVLGSFGFSIIGVFGNGIDVKEPELQRLEITSVTSVMSDSIQQLFEQAGMSVSNRLQSAFGILTTVPLRSLQPPAVERITILKQPPWI